MTEIKAHIKQALQMRNMKQAELADKTGIDKGQISSYISGRYKPKQENTSSCRRRTGRRRNCIWRGCWRCRRWRWMYDDLFYDEFI